MTDITERKHIEKLVNRFYAKVRKDPTIGYIFDDIMKVDWPHHLPRITDFWEAVLFRETLFDGNPLMKHIGVNDRIELKKEHFDTWLGLFYSTVDELFEGPKADEAKFRAGNIGKVFQQHISNHQKNAGSDTTFRLDSLD